MTDEDWRVRARALADRLWAAGDVRTDAWHQALTAVPRHVLVPRAWVQGADLEWTEVDTSTPEGLALVYSPTSLYTKLGALGGVSSSTKPDLMVRMLEALDVRPGSTVLEVGTGSGYNAALLSHRLGDHFVSSVDVDAELVELARVRLAAIGHRPFLAAGDGAEGLVERAPYDRIIVTCSVPSVPTAWIEQVAPGGRVLVSVMPALDAGSMAVLHRRGNALVGHFTRRRVTFMPMRVGEDMASDPTAPASVASRARSTSLAGEPWRDHPLAWLWTALDVPGLGHGYVLDPATRAPRALLLTASDGSRAEVDIEVGAGGGRGVVESGPTALWHVVESHHDAWRALGAPGWDRLGLTVTHSSQTLWLDSADSRHRWSLRPGRRRT